MINVSVSGDTTRTGLSRVDSALENHKPEVVIIALGGNDGLRGLAFSEIETSLSSIIERCKQTQSEILLVGVRMPPNYGAVYSQKFAQLYQRLASHYDIVLLPKMLDQVADNPELMQADGIHPKAFSAAKNNAKYLVSFKTGTRRSRQKITMNQINPEKLLHSKWTALQVKQKERHFIVSRLQRADDETILSCELEAIINNNVYQIDWQQLKDSSLWLMGWK